MNQNYKFNIQSAGLSQQPIKDSDSTKNSNSLLEAHHTAGSN